MLYRPYHFPPLDLVQADSLQQTSAPAGERERNAQELAQAYEQAHPRAKRKE